jgi:Tfp pilus assembly protein PilF
MFGNQGGAIHPFQRLSSCAAWALVFCVLATTWLFSQGSGPDSIHGKITGQGGRPLAVMVSLKTQAGYVIDTVYSDSTTGQFTFIGARDGTYHIIVDDKEYGRGEASATVDSTFMPTTFVYISVTPPGNNSAPPPKGYSESPHAISVQELRTKFPKDAVKEYERGNKKMAGRDLNGAIAHFENAVALAPAMFPAWNNLGNAYLQAHQMDEAEAAFQRAVSENPGGADAYVNLGHLYYETKNYSEAERLLMRAVEYDPQVALAYFFLGLTYEHAGKLSAAEKNLEKALEGTDPAVLTAHLVLADLFIRTDRPDKAREHLEAYLRDRPGDPQADHIRKVLARLKSQTQ